MTKEFIIAAIEDVKKDHEKYLELYGADNKMTCWYAGRLSAFEVILKCMELK